MEQAKYEDVDQRASSVEFVFKARPIRCQCSDKVNKESVDPVVFTRFSLRMKALVYAALAFSSVACKLVSTPLKCINGGQIAITIDGGPSPNTPELLQSLKRLKVPALFFLDSEKLALGGIPSIMKTIVDHGHILGMKLNTSTDINKVSDDLLRGGLEEHMRIFREAIGKMPVFIKVPEHTSSQKLDFLSASGFLVTTPSLDLSKDWSGSCGHRFNSTFVGAALDSSFVVSLGDTETSCSVKEYEGIFETAQSLGFELVRMDHCINLRDSYRSQGASKPIDFSLYDGLQPRTAASTDDAASSLSKLSSSAVKLRAAEYLHLLVLIGTLFLVLP